MKVLLHYSPPTAPTTHKTLKITLPKKWLTKPPSTSLLPLFLDSYNASLPNPDCSALSLEEGRYNLCLGSWIGLRLSGDDCTNETHIPNNSDVYIVPTTECFARPLSPSIVKTVTPTETTTNETEIPKSTEVPDSKNPNLSRCVHLGCQKYYPHALAPPPCSYHLSPPVFHDTGKWWSCCPGKKAYDWDSFQLIPGCTSGICSVTKDSEFGAGEFMGGVELRGGGDKAELKSVEGFNLEDDAKKGLKVMSEFVQKYCDVDEIFFEQACEIVRGKAEKEGVTGEVEVLKRMGQSVKDMLKGVVREGMRIS